MRASLSILRSSVFLTILLTSAASLSSCDLLGSGIDPSKVAAEINNIVGGVNDINTNKTPDPEPVKVGEPATDSKTLNDGTAMVCTMTKYSLTKVPDRFVALNPNADVLWPGSLVQGKSMAGGVLDPIPIQDRAPGTITLTLASGGGGPFSGRMEKPALSAATQTINEILSNYKGATPAKFSYQVSEIYSMEQLAVAVDASVSGTSFDAAGSLQFSQNDEYNRVLVQFTQEFFTMAFDPPQGASGVFGSSVKASDLEPYVEPGNPPVYISSVAYGRIFYFLFESTSSLTDLKVAVAGSYTGVGITATGAATTEHQSIVNKSSIKTYGLGGNAQAAIEAATGYSLGSPDLKQYELIRKFLTTQANFSPDNPGVPISYTIRYLKNSQQVKIALTTEYIAKDCVPVPGTGPTPTGIVSVKFHGIEYTNVSCNATAQNFNPYYDVWLIKPDNSKEYFTDMDSGDRIEGIKDKGYWDNRGNGTKIFTVEIKDSVNFKLGAHVWGYYYVFLAPGGSTDAGEGTQTITYYKNSGWQPPAESYNKGGESIDGYKVSGTGGGCGWEAYFSFTFTAD